MPSPSPARRSRRSVRLLAASAGAAALAAALTGCGSSDAPQSSADAAERTVTDATGVKVAVPAHPKRVVALGEMDVDGALALGVKPVGLTAGRGQQGAPGYLADRAKGVPVVGAVTGPDLEKVAEAKPDLILAGSVTDRQVLSELRKFAPTVVTYGKRLDWRAAFHADAAALNRTAGERTFLARYDARLKAVRKDLGDRVHDTVSIARYSAKGTAVIQQGVFASAVAKDIGFARPGLQTKKGQGHSTPISDEDLQQIDGDWLFIGTLSSTGKDASLFRQLRKEPAYRQLTAVKDGHTTEIDGSKWTSQGGPLAALSVLGDIDRAMKH